MTAPRDGGGRFLGEDGYGFGVGQGDRRGGLAHPAGLRLLLVEDSESDAFFVRELVADWAEVRHVERLGTAVEELGGDAYDAVLLDLGLPDAGGLEGLDEIRMRYPLVPVIVLTGAAQALALRALRAGAQDYLSKDDLTESTLMRAVLHGLARHRQIERIEAQRQRAESRGHDLRSVLDAVPDAIVLFDDAGSVLLANDPASRWLLPDGARHLSELPVRDADQLARARFEAVETRARLSASGEERWLSLRIVPAWWAGQPLSCLVVRDITQRKRSEAAAIAVRESERLVALGQLAASVAHEINNPMAAITANLEVLRERARELAGEESLAMVGECLDASRRISVIVGDLLTFARAERAEVGPVRLERVLDASMNLSANRIRREGIAVERRYGAVPRVQAVEGRLLQVASNLIANALDALREAGRRRLVLETGTWEGGVFLAVEDDGVGMSDETAQHAEEAFFTTKANRGGTGLGLTVSADIARAHGGSLTIRSAAGAGTRVELRLPFDTGLVADETGPQPASTPPNAAAQARPARVVLVDDEEMVCRAYKRLLEPECEVTTFGSAAAALAGLEDDGGVDLVLCDVEMPEMSGPAFLRAVRARYPALVGRLVFYTGGVFDAETARDLLDQSVRVLPKPVSKQVVLELARDHARARGQG